MAPKPIQTSARSGKRRKKERPQPKNWLHGLWLNWIKPIGLAVLVVFSFRWTIADWNDVPSGSMEPTILTGDRILVNKLAYHLKFPFTHWKMAQWDTPQRGEIIIFKSPENGRRMVKRVIGVPGDIIEVRDDALSINGRIVERRGTNEGPLARLDLSDKAEGNVLKFYMEPLGAVLHPIMFQSRKARGRYSNFGPVEVPEGHYFAMGDNRNNSRDSRERQMGFVPLELITGRAFGVAFSWDTEPKFSVRWDRLCRGFAQESIESAPDA